MKTMFASATKTRKGWSVVCAECKYFGVRTYSSEDECTKGAVKHDRIFHPMPAFPMELTSGL